ncbi:MAG: hypothetical protein KGL39_46665 [Patescibacteria group bacterium]|nr:hypothetical protein [Patescibacteria group bacterium]
MITWNWPNWITVVLMVALGYLAVSIVAQLVRGRLGMKAANGNTPGGTGGAFAGVFSNSMFAKVA